MSEVPEKEGIHPPDCLWTQDCDINSSLVCQPATCSAGFRLDSPQIPRANPLKYIFSLPPSLSPFLYVVYLENHNYFIPQLLLPDLNVPALAVPYSWCRIPSYTTQHLIITKSFQFIPLEIRLNPFFSISITVSL